jgi:4-amino-4-deoxy-L-arabinose transferase-like glycosyltransferase
MTKKKYFILLLLILAIGAFFRFYLIKEMPGGLFPDEAANGLDINNIFKGFWTPFFGRGNGREGLFFYMLALSVKFFGRGVWQHHIVSATVGMLTILTTYFVTEKLFDKKTALLSSFLVAVGTWPIVLSRTAFRANLIPLFTTLTIYFFVRVFQAKTSLDRYLSATLAGAFFAGGFYTYIAFRIMVVILGFIFALMIIADRKQNFLLVRSYWKSFCLAIIAFLLIFAPIGYYFLSNPGSFVGRSSQVSIFNPDLNHGNLLGTALKVFGKSVVAYFTHGDLNWRHNVSGQAFLSPLISPFFGIGLLIMTVLAFRFIWQAFSGRQNNAHLKYLLLISMFWGMLVPSITTAEGIPHGLRSIGTMPWVYIITAVTMFEFAKRVLLLWHPQWMEKLYALVVVLFFATLAFTAYTQYFVYAYNSPENFEAFRSDLTTVSNYLNAHPDKRHNFLVLDGFSEMTVDYLTTTSNNSYVIVDPQDSAKLNLQKGDRVIFAQSSLGDAVNYVKAHKNIKTTEETRNKFNQIVMVVYEVTTDDKSLSATLNNDGSFVGLNFGDKVTWSWTNQTYNPWSIKIWECIDSTCTDSKLIKEDQQNDYYPNTGSTNIDGTKKDLYYKAQGFDSQNRLIKNFGTIKLSKYIK